MNKRPLPSNASVATVGENGQLVAPAASRNVGALCDLLDQFAPLTGQALELASGTGQHIAAFAECRPGMHWQPSEVESERRASINAYTAGLPNVSKAVALDATIEGWHQPFGGRDLIVLINLLHLISWAEVETLVGEAAQALNANGRLVLYGPFMRNNRLTSAGDQRFHTALVQQDAEIGYKNDGDVSELLANHDLKILEIAEMPANNLAFIVEKSNT
ncbi:DUF938 domain-containing protein [Ruegeria faecimaris]|uniref:DUF938 domain-containing protein n=1 Tax=Ruegeria faecimaris TaxID=686389 RepID=UPI002493B910|nr:DUF938 domain-containing protein [Ruegeria faecimaris]